MTSTTTMAMVPEQQRSAPSARCEECSWGQCDFKPVRVRFYLLVWRQARLSGEPFDHVLRHRTRQSRAIDPAVRGQGYNWQKARVIGWSLDEVARAHGLAFMHADNAEAVAKLLCPERYAEDA